MMTNIAKRATGLLLAAACVLGAGLTAGCNNDSGSGTQPSPSIAFVTPPPGATVEQGKTIEISLRITNPGAFTSDIYVVGQGGLGAAAVSERTPYAATIAVPQDAALGDYTLTAMGRTATSPAPLTATTAIRVVPPGGGSLGGEQLPGPLVFEAIGERLPITVPGASSGLAFRSAAPTVATVSDAGIVTARTQGETTVAVSSNGSPVGSVQVRVLAPALLPNPTQIAFGDQPVGTTSAAQNVTITNETAYPVNILAVRTGTVFPETDDCSSASPLAPGASCTLSVSFAPTLPGSVDGAVTIVGSAVIAATRILLSGNGT